MSHLVMIHFLRVVIWVMAGRLFNNGGEGDDRNEREREFEWQQQQLRDWQEQLRDHD